MWRRLSRLVLWPAWALVYQVLWAWVRYREWGDRRGLLVIGTVLGLGGAVVTFIVLDA
jgi:hypothetical protein